MTLSASERRFDIGNFDSYFRTFAEFALSDPQYGPAANSRQWLDNDASGSGTPGEGRRRDPACMELLRRRAYARAGLMGNPSDGYHGKTLSVIVRNFHAEVVLYEWEDVEIVLTPGGSQPVSVRGGTGARCRLARLLRRHPAGQGHDQEVRRVLPRAARVARPQFLDPLPRRTFRGRWAWPAPARSSWPRCAP